MNLYSYLEQHTQLPEKAVKNTVDLLNADCTLPFISRYRKEATGGLDEVQIAAIIQFKAQYEALEKRKTAILKAIDEQDALTPELRQKIERSQDLVSLEDLYLPFKKKRKTKRLRPPEKMDSNLWQKSSWRKTMLKLIKLHLNI